MKATALKTHSIKPLENIYEILDQYIPSLKEGTVLAVTSKILSLCQGRVIEKETVENKYALVKKEAEAYLPEEKSLYGAHLTIKCGILIPSAGIDESNGGGMYILYPEGIQETAAAIWQYLREKRHLTHVGVIITDSHTTPLRKGVTGIALGWCGFRPLHSYVGKPDIFDHPLHVTAVNILDGLAATAVFVMGEGAEQTPIALIEDAPKMQFLDHPPTSEEEKEVCISLEEDIYAPLLKAVEWTWNPTKGPHKTP